MWSLARLPVPGLPPFLFSRPVSLTTNCVITVPSENLPRYGKPALFRNARPAADFQFFTPLAVQPSRSTPRSPDW